MTSTNMDIESEKYNNLNTSQFKKDLSFFTKDFLFFKNDILKELKNLEFKLEVQKKANAELKNKLSLNDTKLAQLNNKLESISTVINDKEAATNYYKEKIDLLMEFKNKTEGNLASQEYKIKVNAGELRNAINKYDKAIYENISSIGSIGKNSRFKDFNEMINYILSQIKIFSIYKDKNEVDLKSYKVKLDSIVNSLNFQISGIIGNANSFATANIKEVEKKCLNEIKSFNDKLMKLRVENLELKSNFENEKNQIFEEWKNIKNMKQELSDLVDSSIKKLNKSNNTIQKTLDNYEKQFNDMKSSISSITEIYNKMKLENINNEDQQDFKINATKSDFFKLNNSIYGNEKNNPGVKRLHSAKSVLQNYIEGNSIYQELVEKNSLRCKQHENGESPVEIMMRKYYDEGINNIINVNAFKTIENITNKNNLTDRNKYQTVNSTPKTNVNSNKTKPTLEENHLNDNEIKNSNKYVIKNRKHSFNRKFILVKEGHSDINNSHNIKKTKSKEADKRITQQEKFAESFIDKSRLTKLKLLSSISFLCDDENNKQLPKLDKIENNKNEELFIKTGKSNRINKNKMDISKIREYNALSSLKHSNSGFPKTQKLRSRINSTDSTKHHIHNIHKDADKDNSLNNINRNNEYTSEKIKKIEEKLKKKRKSSELNKKSFFRIKSEKIK